jgi:hypothetical protein
MNFTGLEPAKPLNTPSTLPHRRRPELLDDLVAGILVDALERRHLLVAEGEVVGDGGHSLDSVVAHGVPALPRRGRGADDERVGLPLCNVLGRRETDERGGLVPHLVGDGKQLEGGERAEDDVDLVDPGRIAAGVGDQQLHLLPCVALLLGERRDPLLHLDAALGERAGLNGQKSNLAGHALRESGRREFSGSCTSAGRQHALQDGSALDSMTFHSVGVDFSWL